MSEVSGCVQETRLKSSSMAPHAIGCMGGTALHVIRDHMTSLVHTWSL